MDALIILCALALPATTAPGSHKDYDLLVKFIEHYRPGYTMVLVNPDEKLLNDAWVTPITYRGLTVWMIRDQNQMLLRAA